MLAVSLYAETLDDFPTLNTRSKFGGDDHRAVFGPLPVQLRGVR